MISGCNSCGYCLETVSILTGRNLQYCQKYHEKMGQESQKQERRLVAMQRSEKEKNPVNPV